MNYDQSPKRRPGPKPPPPLRIDAEDPLGAFDKMLGADPEKARATARGDRMSLSVCPVEPCDGGLQLLVESLTGEPTPIRYRESRAERPEILEPEDAPEGGMFVVCDGCGRKFRAVD